MPRDQILRRIRYAQELSYLLALLLQLYPQHKDNTVTTALTMLFDDPQYPKVDRKGKRKSDTSAHDNRPGKKAKVDYVDYSRQDRESHGSEAYVDLTLVNVLILQYNYIYNRGLFIGSSPDKFSLRS